MSLKASEVRYEIYSNNDKRKGDKNKMFKQLKNLYILITKDGVEFARYKGVKVGKNCRLLTRSIGSEPWLITIGNNVTLAAGVTFITHDGSTGLVKDKENVRRYKYSPITIGDNVFVGVNSLILPGVKIEDDVIVAAGSVVNKSVPKGSIVGGVPAKVIGEFKDYEKRVLNEYVSEKEMDFSKSYKDRIDEVVDFRFKEFVKKKK